MPLYLVIILVVIGYLTGIGTSVIYTNHKINQLEEHYNKTLKQV